RIGEGVAVGADQLVLEPDNGARVVAEGAVAVVGDGRARGAGGIGRVAGNVVVGRDADRRNHADRGGAVLVDGAAVDGARRHGLGRHLIGHRHRRRGADVAVAVLGRIGEGVAVGADQLVLEPANGARVVAEGAVAVVGDGRARGAGGIG